MIYWDHNATTPLHPTVATGMSERLRADGSAWGNPSSIHGQGRAARAELDGARSRLAKRLGAEPKEVCFTGSGSEAAALALRGLFLARGDKKRTRIVTSAIEHAAVLGTVAQLEREGAEIIRLAPDARGLIPPEAIDEALTSSTALCSLMWANNETGVLQPVQQTARWCEQRGIAFHSDAVQAAGKINLTFSTPGMTALTLSAHKFGGPAGIGAAIIRRGAQVLPLIAGHQELGRRGGTQSPLLGWAMAEALELTTTALDETSSRVGVLRDGLEHQVRAALPGVYVNGEGAHRVYNTSNLRFDGLDGEALLIALDLEGICISSGAACASGTSAPSHVLRAMGLSAAGANESIRFSLGSNTTDEELAAVVRALVHHVPRVRALQS